MKKLFLVAALAALTGLACGTAGGNGNGNGNQQPIVTTSSQQWVSEGADIAPLLAGSPFNYTKITAQFLENGSYTVVATDNTGKQTTLTGTYTTEATTVTGIRNITVNQSAPSTLTSKGIYQVDTTVTPNRMTYEIVQTDPPLSGVTPPTAEAGFGSTSNGAFQQKNVQKYSRQ